MRQTITLAGLLLVATTTASAQDDFEKRVAGKTAAEVNKNIQVLKTIPAVDLFPAMQFMAASLGVRCEYCHVTDNTGRWPMEKDDKPPKAIARRMLTMVQQINATQFDGQNRITCASCHHGSVRPSPQPPLFDPAAPSRLVPARDVKDPLPTPAQVLDKFVAAIGGREVNARVRSRASKGTVTAGTGGQPLRFEVVEAAPDRRTVTTTGQRSTTIEVVDGAEVWIRDEFGVRAETGNEARGLRRLADFHGNEKLGDLDAALEILGTQAIGGRPAIVLSGTLPTKQIERLFFDADSGLLVRRVVLSPTPLGLIPEQTDYEDYRAVGDVKLPFVVRRTGSNFSDTQKFEEIRLNVPVDPSIFLKPSGR